MVREAELGSKETTSQPWIQTGKHQRGEMEPWPGLKDRVANGRFWLKIINDIKVIL